MTTFIEKYFKVLVILLLLICCFLFYASLNNGKYMVCPWGEYVCVLDTETGQLWFRQRKRNIDLGTCQNPTFEIVKTEKNEAELIDKEWIPKGAVKVSPESTEHKP